MQDSKPDLLRCRNKCCIEGLLVKNLVKVVIVGSDRKFLVDCDQPVFFQKRFGGYWIILIAAKAHYESSQLPVTLLSRLG